jgi:threonine/homoserine/homoserine lactone efflux protein
MHGLKAHKYARKGRESGCKSREKGSIQPCIKYAESNRSGFLPEANLDARRACRRRVFVDKSKDQFRRLSMTLAQWLPFALASAVLLAIPGPTVLLVVSYALGHGRKYAFATTAGVALGDLTAMTASMLGLGVLLAASAELFFTHAYAVTTLNPKSIIFFVAFLPQFIDPHAASVTQIAIFEATFVGLGAANALAYALLASSARRAIRKASVQRAVNRTGGALLMGAGVFAAAWTKAT